MAFKLSKAYIPWFIWPVGSITPIILPTVPLKVSTKKPINWAEIDVPGMHTKPMQFSNFGPSELAFEIVMVKKNKFTGILPLASLFQTLRNPDYGITGILTPKQNRNAEVLFWYESGFALPLFYFLTQCELDFDIPNQLGYPQRMVAQISLKLNEFGTLYSAELVARKVLSIIGAVSGIRSYVKSVALRNIQQRGGRNKKVRVIKNSPYLGVL